MARPMRDVERNNPMEPPSFYDGALEPVTLSVPPHPPPPPLLLPPRASRALRMSRELGKQGAGSREKHRRTARAPLQSGRCQGWLAWASFHSFSFLCLQESNRFVYRRSGVLGASSNHRPAPDRAPNVEELWLCWLRLHAIPLGSGNGFTVQAFQTSVKRAEEFDT